MAQPDSLIRDISPPATRRSSVQTQRLTPSVEHQGTRRIRSGCKDVDDGELEPTLAAVEAGKAEVREHLEYFARHLSAVKRASPQPTISITEFRNLYKRNHNAHGHHFVIHQHDHPISGVHYDLRLQFSETSSVSWAIPYGLPGNANSVRPNRMAIETRVHNLWQKNNLIESASHATGSLLIWDTGEYEVLESRTRQTHNTDDEHSGGDDQPERAAESQNGRLRVAFQSRHIHLRLNGARLPPGYTIALRLPSQNDAGKQPRRKRRRLEPGSAVESTKRHLASFKDDDDSGSDNDQSETASIMTSNVDAAMASESEGEDATIRANNAYPGATNSIGSLHQRHWLLRLDLGNSGFSKARSGNDEGRWIGPWTPFFVRGRDYERSVVTGRLADDVMADEDVDMFVGRKMWRPILE
ncbi:hypothetical protein BAUCODRAFT_129101 [Baudoinia panamericana UAMH 10762]|uniref:DNA ligase D 3'-phosphoesterase domain-containing protein n=1 Tax=Baudoinia panamericana (strain UAMH 10762) TaxID=717646 RepID=M2NI78_BAUPA|nr:uncharacterized protein BAUCODRAFT_129101 [Baudoinia panamericana UAMH 10762]EMC98795.1 hypothetical protein BAUCODRAFT_129101 [Baudoinia panamericana UAMH 10762]